MHRRTQLRFALALLVIAALLLSLAHGLTAPAVLAIALLAVAMVLVAESRIEFEQPARRSLTVGDRILGRSPPA